MELLRLRVKDVDFARNQIVIRVGKGAKDRVTVLPESMKEELRTHLEKWRLEHQREQTMGRGATSLPQEVERKHPKAATEWIWQYVFRRITYHGPEVILVCLYCDTICMKMLCNEQ